MWIYIPTTSPSTQEADNSIKDLSKDSLKMVSQALSQSVTWRETSKQPRYWSTKYSQEKWVKHLYGLIPNPSTANHSLGKWMQSLEDSPVSPGPLPGEKKEKMIKDGSGNISRESLMRYDQKSYSWKMSQASFLEEVSQQFFPVLPKSGMMLNGSVYQLPQWEHLIDEKESSSWPTPLARDWKGGTRKGTDYYGLDTAAERWMTPNTMDALPPKSQETLDREATTTRKGRKRPANLRDQVNVVMKQTHWLTPTANEDHAGTTEGKMQWMLAHQTQEYMENQDLLQHQTTQLGEISSDIEKTSLQPWQTTGNTTWKTPLASDGEGGTKDMKKYSTRTKLGDQVGSRKRLNPKFVEWLMGWEENWILFLKLGYSDTSETE